MYGVWFEGVCFGIVEVVLVGDCKMEMFFYVFVGYYVVGIVVFESQWVFGFGLFVGNLVNVFEIFFLFFDYFYGVMVFCKVFFQA